jgi:hypothetical protein
MNPERDIFLGAMDCRSPGEQAEYLSVACGADEALRSRVESLLSAHARDAGFLDRPAAGAETAAETRTPVVEPPGARVDRYLLGEILGEGGFGIVYQAEQCKPVRRTVALKIIKPGMDTRRVVARFEAERQALALMNHPNIAGVFDGGTTSLGRPYFVMELVRGRPITRHCDERRATIRERLELFLQVCDAIHHAHQRGVLHRDIKPGNVLVAFQDDAPVPKVIDFGIAKAIQPDTDDATILTRPHELLGTPAYMSPEQTQLSGHDVDTRTDVYSLGVLLYELLTGQTPLDARTLLAGDYADLCRRLRELAPLKPSARLASLPPDQQAAIAECRRTDPRRLSRSVRGDLDRIVMKALEKERSHRYESARELADDIRRHLRGEPVTACPPRFGYRLRLFVRRHRAAVLAATLVCLALTTGTALSLWQAREARRETVRARNEAATAAAVTRFLNDDLFSMADPATQPDREITVRALLDRASRQLPSGLSDQPLVLAAIHGTLGRTYARLSQHEQANHHLDQAHSLYLRELGERDEKTIEALLAMAASHNPDRSLHEATTLTEKARDLALAELGPQHPVSIRCLMSLAWRYYTAQRRADAFQAAAQAWSAAQAAFPTPEGEAWPALHMLARQKSAEGDVAGGEALLRRAAEVNLSAFGPQHQWTIRAREGLAAYLYDRNLHLDEAERLYRESLQARLAIYGEDHDSPQHVRRNLALLLEATNRHREAWQEQITVAEQRPAIREAHSDMDRLRLAQPLRPLSDWAVTPSFAWRFLSTQPGDAWRDADYADAWWPSSMPAGALDVWARCLVVLRTPPPAGARLLFRWQGAGRCEVFINGQPALREPRRPREGERYGVCVPEAVTWLQPGENVIALRLRNVPAEARLAPTLGAEWLVFEPPP